jgi:hypothetical protein
MMTEEMMKQMPAHMMGNGMGMMGHPVAQGAMMAATGFAAGKGLLGGTLLRNPLVLLAAGAAAGYLLFKYEKEIILALSKATGMGKDFVLQQKENLDDLMAEAQDKEAAQGAAAPTAAPTAPKAPKAPKA